MHAKIMLLPGSARGEALCRCAEQVLTDVSAAFQHSFSLLREKIGEQSLQAYQEPLTEEAVAACEKCRAVLLGDGEGPGTEALYDALNLPLEIRSFCVPDALCGRHEPPVSLWLARVLSLDAETLAGAMESAFRFAQETETHITAIAPQGAAKAAWDAAVQAQAARRLSVRLSSLSAPEAARMLITDPSGLGVLLCPPYAGGIFSASAAARCSRPAVIHAAAFDEETGVYAPCPPPEDAEDTLAAFGMVRAVANLLRFALGLSREASCVEAALNNVFISARKGADWAEDSPVTPEQIVSRVGEQIAVAGELAGKSLFSH